MESPGDAPRMQPGPEARWQDFFPKLTFEPHDGQRRSFDIAAMEAPATRLIVLPTGYGKTRAGLGFYAIRRAQGIANRCLWIVSSDEQLKQLSPEPDRRTGKRDAAASDRLTEWFGVPGTETVTCTGVSADIAMHQRDRAEIFVASYQFLRLQSPYFSELMDDREGRYRWLIIADEAHHLHVKGAWASWLEPLPRSEVLYMSATPVRTDQLPLRNVPRQPGPEGKETYKAAVEVSWKGAIRERAIRMPVAHAEDWKLEFKDKSGTLVNVTTSELRDKGITGEHDFDEWLVRHDLHYTMTYLDKIVLDAVNALFDKRARAPWVRHQMIVFAMSCSHAKFLVNEGPFKRLSRDMGLRADWIGVTRPDDENKVVMAAYKRGDLDVLVQVDKAGEGFDNPATDVGLFLNLVQSETKLLQQLGRLLRRLFLLLFEQDVAEIFADSSHPVIGVVRSLRPKDFWTDPSDGPGQGGGGGGDFWPPLPGWSDIVAEWLTTETVVPDGMQHGHAPGVLQAAEKFGVTPEQVQEILRLAQGAMPEGQGEVIGEVGHRAAASDKVDKALTAVTRHAIRLLARGEAITRDAPGRIKRNLNARWKASNASHDEMLAEDFERKYNWLKDLDDQMLAKQEVPSWLTRR